MANNSARRNPSAEKATLVFSPKIDSRIFRDFSIYHALHVQKIWRRPLLFSLIFLAFSLVCFVVQGRTGDGLFLGVVLLCVGIGLPLVYLASFYGSVRRQSARMGLDKPKSPYFLSFFEDRLQVRYPAAAKAARALPSETYSLKEIQRVVRRKQVTYLYVSAAKAFLLPDGQSDHTDEEVQTYFRQVFSAEQYPR